MKRTLGIRDRSGFLCAALVLSFVCFIQAGCGSQSAPPPPPPPISVSITPVRGGAVISQSITFTAAVQNDMGAAGVTWSAPSGSFSNKTTTTATFVAPNTTGNVTITATSVADGTKSASATMAITDLAGVTTYHNDLSRDGANTHEFALTTSNVKTPTFGKLFSCAVDGAIYAQPLWASQLTVNGAKHNVVIVATMHDSVYAFDADANARPCVPLWHANLLDSAHGGMAGEQAVPSGNGGLVGAGFGDIAPEVGVTGTPVIDAGTNILYLVSKSLIPAGPTFFQRLHALDLTTGNEKLNSNKPLLITASVPGTGDGSMGGNVAFDPRQESQRAGLALLPNGIVYVAWASHEDASPYHGWVMGFDKTSLNEVSVYNSAPNGRQGGIWMSGGAPAADASNNLYVITGNGNYDGITDFGDSILKLSTAVGLNLTDWFTPSDQANLDSIDLDLGSGGAVVLLDQPSGPVRHLLIGGGKQGSGNPGEIFVLNRDLMGQFSTTDGGVVQKFPLNNAIFATPAFWQNNLYIAGVGGPLTAFSLNPATGQFNPMPTSQSASNYNFPGATPAVSASGATNNGIVWTLDDSQYCTAQSPGCQAAVLHAYDGANVQNELWNSNMVAGDAAGLAVKFTVPTIANGKVYVCTRGNDTGAGTSTTLGELDVYGLKPN